MLLTDLATEKFDIGKAAILTFNDGAGGTVWDGTADLFANMTHVGTTEGPVELNANPEYSELQIETLGPAALKRYLSGERPSFELGVFPNPDAMAYFSPTGRASAGHKRRALVKSHTIWIVAEQLFLDDDQEEVAITYVAGEFLKAGVSLTAAEQAMVDESLLIWKADYTRAVPVFRHEDGGKSLRNVTVTVQQDLDKPNGCQLYLVLAELADFPDIDFIPPVS